MGPRHESMELVADAYHQWQYGDNGTHDTLVEAARVAHTIVNALEQRPDLLRRLAEGVETEQSDERTP